MSEDKILIPLETLADGFEKCKRHIEELLKSSESLYNEKHYANSLAIAILAIEENAKLKVILNCILEKRGISKKEWYEITGRGSHEKKLIKNVEDRQKELRDLTYETYLDEVERSLELGFDISSSKSFEQLKYQALFDVNEQVKKFNLLKQDCFYLNWNGNDWFSFITNAPKNIQEAFAFVNLHVAKSEWINIVLKQKYLGKSWSESGIIEKFKSEPLLEIIRKQSTFAFQNLTKKKVRLSFTYFEHTYLKNQKKRKD